MELLVIEVFLEQGGKLQLEIFHPPENKLFGLFLTFHQFHFKFRWFSDFQPPLYEIEHVWAEEEDQRDEHILFLVLDKTIFKSWKFNCETCMLKLAYIALFSKTQIISCCSFSTIPGFLPGSNSQSLLSGCSTCKREIDFKSYQGKLDSKCG